MYCGTRNLSAIDWPLFFAYYISIRTRFIDTAYTEFCPFDCMGCAAETVKMLLPIEILVECYIIQH